MTGTHYRTKAAQKSALPRVGPFAIPSSLGGPPAERLASPKLHNDQRLHHGGLLVRYLLLATILATTPLSAGDQERVPKVSFGGGTPFSPTSFRSKRGLPETLRDQSAGAARWMRHPGFLSAG